MYWEQVTSAPGLGVALALGLVAIHLWLAYDRTTQFKIVLFTAVLGLLIDSLQLWCGIFTFSEGIVVPWLPPPWMTVLWIQFATTFRYCLSRLNNRPFLSSFFGLIGAPLAFFAGERLGAITFLTPRILHFGVLALIWSFAVPLLFLLRIFCPPIVQNRRATA